MSILQTTELYFAFGLVILSLMFALDKEVGGIKMDVKCTVYEHSDDLYGNNVDVRILVMGLKPDTDYTAKVIPDHNPPASLTTKTDVDGTFWAAAKVPNGEKSTLFSVTVYQTNSTARLLVASGDDDAPCFKIVTPSNKIK